MSDRLKGLLEAFATVAPKSDIKFCARHIWANFKLKFSGQAFKEPFWKAAKTTSKAIFDKQMEDIKDLNPMVHAYLADIPTKHWSRHVFPPTSKSNMLLNNICESFNNVLKEARDKPILTFMEWIRRYIMKRSSEKREGVHGLTCTLMPYVVKYLRWAHEESRHCDIIPSTLVLFEVDHFGESYVVNLDERTCGCYHWDLTGLPCPHAMACIGSQPLNPDEYVHEAYSKRLYIMAHEPSIAPMPGIKKWEKVNMLEPLPPPYKNMSGRPSLKKRKKATDEDATNLKRPKISRVCSRCGASGHNKRRCKNLVLPPELRPPKEVVKAPSRDKKNNSWANKVREMNAKKASMRASCSQQSTSQEKTVQLSCAGSLNTRPPRKVKRKVHFES